MAKKRTVFQALDSAISGNWGSVASPTTHTNSYDMTSKGSNVIYKTTNKDDYEQKKLELQQNRFLKERWVKANVNMSVTAFAGLNNVKLMYRDADLMDAFPEIGAALDIVSEESALADSLGSIVTVQSKSERVKSILEDLFVNRLNLQLTAQMVIRALCKYGNQFMLLDIDHKNGVKGWKQLPVFNVERIENGIQNPYGAGASIAVNGVNIDNADLSTQFIWLDDNNSQIPFRDWQIAHFRLITNSLYLPYGCIVGDTKIETEDGYKEIQDIRIGDKVWTFNTSTQERELALVTMQMNKGEKDVYRISTKHNFLEGTSDHKILCAVNGKFEYKEIKDITINDLVAIRQGSKIGKDIKIDKTKMPSSRNRGIKWFDDNINIIPDYINSELAELFGFIIGDGSVTYDRIITLAGGVQDSFNDKYQELLEKYSNSKGKRYYRSDGSLRAITFNSRFFGELLKRLGYICGYNKKRIPSWVFESKEEIKKAFIKGLINADGYMFIDERKKNPNIRYDIELENESLIKDLKILVQSLGWKSGQIFSRSRESHFSKKIGKIMNFSGKSFMLSFYETYNSQEKVNDTIGRLTNEYKLEKVRSIEYIGRSETYDITVSNDNSNFFANGIITHNCSYLNSARRHWRMLSLMEDMMLIYRLERSVERRVYKIFVGAIDDADVGAYVEQIANEFKRTPIIDPMTGQLDLRKNILPVHKDTPIPLLDGRTITIEELSKEFSDGKENYVYSIQDKTLKIVPGKVVWCGKNYTAEKLIRITLDDGSHFDLAAEHELIMRDGTKKRADEVSVGESVMPFYRKVDKDSKKLFDRYEKVFNPNSGKYEFTHRIIAETVEKENDLYNTVHHKDFNKYNNSPCNLTWMDYNEHHKMHGDLARNNWKDPIKRKRHIENLSKACRGRIITEEVKEKISKTIKSKYDSGEFDFVRDISKKHMIEYNKSEKAIERRREQGIKLGYREEFKAYNESELHKQHNEIRKVATAKSWEGNGRTNRIQKMNIHFDDFIWDSLRDNILGKKIVNRKTMLEYINGNLIDHLIEINDNKRLENNHFISREVLENRIRERGFCTITEYIKSMVKNHKIAKIETIEGDDVYCMTVVGQNGEEDRHNFAIRSLKSDGSLNDSGCFVSNCADQDLFIPVRDENAATPIDTLSAGQNMTALDDIKFVQNKVLTALRIPKSFLNFEETAGDGKNLALMDIRFTRTVNRIQQAFLMELTKVASIHLFLLGFDDELNNFTLSMKNPSTQAEQLEIETTQKKIDAVRDAVSDPGNGLPVMSTTRALRQIMKWSDKDIKENFEEIRLEKGIAAELEKTTQIIKKTGIFDTVDRIYGEPGAEYMDDQQGGMGDAQGGDMGGGGGMAPPPDMGGGDMEGDIGGDLEGLGAPGANDQGDISGQEGTVPTQDMPTESLSRVKKPLLTEGRKSLDSMFDEYLSKITESKKGLTSDTETKRVDIYDSNSLLMNEEFDKMISSLGKFVKNDNE